MCAINTTVYPLFKEIQYETVKLTKILGSCILSAVEKRNQVLIVNNLITDKMFAIQGKDC